MKRDRPPSSPSASLIFSTPPVRVSESLGLGRVLDLHWSPSEEGLGRRFPGPESGEVASGHSRTRLLGQVDGLKPECLGAPAPTLVCADTSAQDVVSFASLDPDVQGSV